MTSPTPRRRLDAWALRCLFNKTYRRFIEARTAGVNVKRKPITRKVGDPDPLPDDHKFTCEWTYRDPSAGGKKLADGHFYERADGSTTDPDPKHLEIDGQRYGLFDGTGWIYDVRRDLTVLLKRHGLAYRAYSEFRRFTCAWFGW
jgi:hypothetical protein